MKRILDFLLALGILLWIWPILIVVAVVVKWDSPGPVLYWSDRVGRGNRIFRMPKFRTMRVNAPAVATHLLDNPAQWVTPFGAWLRKTSLGELPQLGSILVGDMSWVGPRPALYNQHDLVEMRTRVGVHTLMPGLTGWAQVNGRDELSLDQKVALDVEYLHQASLMVDAQILWMTIFRVARQHGITH